MIKKSGPLSPSKSSPKFFVFKKDQKLKTCKPLKKHKPGSARYELHKIAKKTLKGINSNAISDGMTTIDILKRAVKVPDGEDQNEWLAVHVYDFYNTISILYGNFMEKCTDSSCPTMSAGKSYVYLWADGDKIKKPIECSAPQYIDNLLNWVQNLLANDSIFPSSADQQFPKNYRSIISDIFRKLLRLFSHIYTTHTKEMKDDDIQWWNHHFRHFYYFIIEFNLVDKKEFIPIEALVTELCPK